MRQVRIYGERNSERGSLSCDIPVVAFIERMHYTKRSIVVMVFIGMKKMNVNDKRGRRHVQ